MRGAEPGQVVLFSYVALDDWIPADHPVRPLKALVEPVLAELSPRFTALYARDMRASIPPEQLLRALLLQVLYTFRSERSADPRPALQSALSLVCGAGAALAWTGPNGHVLC